MEQKRLVVLIACIVLLAVVPLTLHALGGADQTVIVEVVGPDTGPTCTPTCAGTATPTITGTPPTATRTGTATRTPTASNTPTVTYTPRPTNTAGPTPTRVPGTIRRLYLPVVAEEYKRFVGHWAGTTSRGYPMSFDVQEGSLKWANFKLKTVVQMVNCGPGTLTYEITINTPANEIVDDQFSFSMMSYAFSGQFTGGWTASGTYAFDNHRISISPSCSEYITESGTWNAAWQPPVP